MSHNVNKVNSQEPNRAGAITQSFSNLSDVSPSSPSTGQGVAWSGSAWAEYDAQPNTVASAYGIDTATGAFTSSYYDQIYEDADGFYINMRWQFGSPQYLMTLYNNATYASNLVKVFAINSQWWKGFGLQAGYKYQLQADVCIPENSSAGAYVELQWKTSTGTSLGPIGFARRPSENRARFNGFIDLTSASGTTNVGLYNHGMSGNVAWIQAGDDNRQTVLTARIIE
tara:strand:+ start:2486 stop:3166 length:681 start_codon:yes stop_codon:yes gene_type:complete